MRCRCLISALLLIACCAAPAAAQQYLGKTITDMRVEIAGVAATDGGVLDLIQTRIGEPLAMRDVRETIDHLAGLGRFEDVKVFATPSEQGVTVLWQLVPVTRINKITISGDAGLSSGEIRADLKERFGALPSSNRVPQMVARLTELYAARGFEKPSILPRIEDDEERPEVSELVLTIEAGERTQIGAINITGTPLETEAEVKRILGLTPGRPFDQVALDAKIASYEESLRERGYYQARVRESHLPGGSAGMAITIAVETGPHVNLVFAGDPLPEGKGIRDDLVPIRAERSVDRDLLEDASGAIETALRGQGFRNAQAPYTREEKGADLIVTFTITRGPLHRVESIETAGNAHVTAAELAPLLQVKAGDPFVESRVGLIAAAITELYRVRGFAQAAVKPNLQVLPPAQGVNVVYRPVAIRFDITEGPQTIISAVDFAGAKTIPADKHLPTLGLQAGRPFYRPQLSLDRDSIEHAYRNQGFQNVAVTSQLNFTPDQQQVALTWTIKEGDQFKIDRVLINGNVRIDTDLIKRELTIKSGDPTSDDAMIESQRKLAELGLFRRVRITELPRTGSLTRDVLVDLEETNTTTVDYGGGVEVGRIAATSDEGEGAVDKLDIGPRGFFSISRRNLWGKNRSVTLFGRVTLSRREPPADNPDPTDTGGYGFNDYRGLFTFREPRAFGTNGDAQFTAFIEPGRRSSFTFNRRGVTADYARRISAFTVTGRYTFDYTKLFDEQIKAEDQLPIDRLFPQVKLSKIFGGVLRDSRDDVLDPQKGAVVGVDGTIAARVLGSEVGFVKSFLQGFIYRRLPGRRVVVAAGARLGVAVGFANNLAPPLEISGPRQGYGGRAADAPTRAVDRAEGFPTAIRDLPASERFFAGGDTTVRGFALDRLGTAETLDSQGFPQGGNGMAIFNLETRAPYWKNLQFVWFLDAGNVFKNATDIALDELRFSSGLGVRYRSPIGPLRIDWGWKLSTRLLLEGGRERSNVLHISLGQAF
jgi:outer membrane protein assembly factor BamA